MHFCASEKSPETVPSEDASLEILTSGGREPLPRAFFGQMCVQICKKELPTGLGFVNTRTSTLLERVNGPASTFSGQFGSCFHGSRPPKTGFLKSPENARRPHQGGPPNRTPSAPHFADFFGLRRNVPPPSFLKNDSRKISKKSRGPFGGIYQGVVCMTRPFPGRSFLRLGNLSIGSFCVWGIFQKISAKVTCGPKISVIFQNPGTEPPSVF